MGESRAFFGGGFKGRGEFRKGRGIIVKMKACDACGNKVVVQSVFFLFPLSSSLFENFENCRQTMVPQVAWNENQNSEMKWNKMDDVRSIRIRSVAILFVGSCQ
eukprot:TRINITY_DN7975_c0_g1_i1.p1 TRINITY_DN7975_c0_g1~~TRINITY_DN7975_c0_g1_i1.p1  ORF type:complete len:104 (+),score=15.54 TRINITY_DN7975_c0_g1_i1:138-449(+)